jgi:hypothetical protein
MEKEQTEQTKSLRLSDKAQTILHPDIGLIEPLSLMVEGVPDTETFGTNIRRSHERNAEWTSLVIKWLVCDSQSSRAEHLTKNLEQMVRTINVQKGWKTRLLSGPAKFS